MSLTWMAQALFFVYYKAIKMVSKIDLVDVETGEVIPCSLMQHKALDEKSSYYTVLGMSKKPAVNTTHYIRATFADCSVVNTDSRHTYNGN